MFSIGVMRLVESLVIDIAEMDGIPLEIMADQNYAEEQTVLIVRGKVSQATVRSLRKQTAKFWVLY